MDTKTLPKDLTSLIDSSKAIQEKISNLSSDLDAILDEIAEKSEPLLAPLREQTDVLFRERDGLIAQKQELNAKIDAVSSQIAGLQAQRRELGDRVEKVRLKRANNSNGNGGLREDINEAFDSLQAKYPQGIPVKALAQSVAEKRGSGYPNSARQGIEKYCVINSGNVIGMK